MFDENTKKLFALWCEVLDVSCAIDSVTQDEYAELTKSELDSIGRVKFLVLVEEMFDIEFDDEMLIVGADMLFETVATYIR
jgi:acyl carrier protein